MPTVLVLCHGNICRSPMGAFLLRDRAKTAQVPITIVSAGVSAEEAGNPLDPRAARTLDRHGISHSTHRAHQVTDAELADADLTVVMSQRHLDVLTHRLGSLFNDHDIRLIRSFDPAAPTGAEVADPWWGEESGFTTTFTQLDACMPGLLTWARDHA
ncbi:MAG: low molecular weight protein-tyrosine-phosphatase [Propionibacteriaceae bacterium]